MKPALIGPGMVAATHVAASETFDAVSLAGVPGLDAAKIRDFADAQGLARACADTGDTSTGSGSDPVALVHAQHQTAVASFAEGVRSGDSAQGATP